MFSEYDVVQLACDVSPTLPKGTKGTIVMVHQGDPREYLVELFDNEHNTLAVKPLAEWQLSTRDSTTA